MLETVEGVRYIVRYVDEYQSFTAVSLKFQKTHSPLSNQQNGVKFLIIGRDSYKDKLGYKLVAIVNCRTDGPSLFYCVQLAGI